MKSCVSTLPEDLAGLFLASLEHFHHLGSRAAVTPRINAPLENHRRAATGDGIGPDRHFIEFIAFVALQADSGLERAPPVNQFPWWMSPSCAERTWSKGKERETDTGRYVS
jgi:hypothetical protein